MRKILHTLVLSAAAASILVSCSVFEAQTPPVHRVTIMYAAAMSGLSGSISEDIEDICNSSLPTLQSGDVFLVYSHMPKVRGFYDIPSNPVLFRAWRNADGSYQRDTLITYPDTDISSTPEVMNKVLSDVAERFPAPHYAMIVSSHGKGWIPRGYEENAISPFSVQTKELCIENATGSGINVNEFPQAIPIKLDYLVLDSCLMGCIETAYELRGICDYLVFSPTEILVDGFAYSTMAKLITNIQNPDVKGLAREYYEYYCARSGVYRSASITVVDCNALDPLADVCKRLTDKYRDDIAKLKHTDVQAYFYNSLHWFFDLRDIYVQAGISEEETAELDAALEKAVAYVAATPEFLGHKLERICGLSMYLPYYYLTDLNRFYKELSWNKAIGMIK